MKTALLFLIAFSLCATTCPTGTTHIVDVLVSADGSTTQHGTISAKGAAGTTGSQTVVAGANPIPIGTGGAVDFCLVGGVGRRYDATYTLTDPITGKMINTYTERWTVPATTGTLTIRQLWPTASGPSGSSLAQMVDAVGKPDGTYCLVVVANVITGITACTGGGTTPGTWSAMTGAWSSYTGAWSTYH